jgi:hypothetical protein
MNKMLFAILLATIPSIVSAQSSQSKPGKICVWADSEDPGVLLPTQPGGSINAIAPSEVNLIRLLTVEELRKDKSNNVIDPCPQTGENIEIDVVVGQFLGARVASVSFVIQGKEPLHVSSNVVAAMTDELLAKDVVVAYESLKFRIGIGAVK